MRSLLSCPFFFASSNSNKIKKSNDCRTQKCSQRLTPAPNSLRSLQTNGNVISPASQTLDLDFRLRKSRRLDALSAWTIKLYGLRDFFWRLRNFYFLPPERFSILCDK